MTEGLKILGIIRKMVENLEIKESNKYKELTDEDLAYNDALYVVQDGLDEIEQNLYDGTLDEQE